MPRYSKPSEDRWLHPHYRKAYCFKYKNGMVYTCVNSIRQATGFDWKQTNKRVCMDLLNQRLNAIIYKTTDGTGSERRIQDLILRFHTDKLSKLSNETKRQYRILYKQFFQENFLLSDIQKIRISIIDKMNTLTLQPVTLRKRLVRIKGIFNYAIELEWIDKNPIVKSMMPKVKNQDVVICTQEHIDLIIQYLTKNGNHATALCVEFAAITAMRIQEILNLQWSDITPRFIIFKGKGRKERFIPFKPFPRAKSILDELQQAGNPKPFNWLNQQTPAKALRRAIVHLNEEYPDKKWESISFHTFRKVAINGWKKAGINTDARNLIAGHTKDVEKQYYLTDPDIEYLEQQFEKK